MGNVKIERVHCAFLPSKQINVGLGEKKIIGLLAMQTTLLSFPGPTVNILWKEKQL
jgi:hypothetical protein